MNRRTLLALAAPLLPAAAAPGPPSIRAVAFDAFAVFDPRPIAARAAALFPGRSAELMALWRTRQFEYTWLRTLTFSYTDFWTVTEEALVYAARTLKLDLPLAHRRHLMSGFSELRAWPEAPAALDTLRAAGIRLVLLSNFTPAMLASAVANSRLQSLFEPPLSTDRVRAYKPDPRAYRMAVDALNLQRGHIAFAAFAGWDAAGARTFGFPTFWVNRMDAPAEELGAAPDAVGRDLNDLARFVLGSTRRE